MNNQIRIHKLKPSCFARITPIVLLKNIGRIVYLQLSYEALEKRLGNLKGRGVVLRDGQTLKDIYEERSMLYKKYADIIVNEEDLDIEKTLQKIIECITI